MGRNARLGRRSPGGRRGADRGSQRPGERATDVDHHLIRDAQRVIESVEALVRIHNAQEEDIYEHA